VYRNIITFHDNAQAAVARGDSEHKVSFATIKQHMAETIAKVIFGHNNILFIYEVVYDENGKCK
jgi:hypothetical protein